MNEDKKNWNEKAKTMMEINRKTKEMFNTIHIKDQDQLEHTWHLLDSNDNMHSITYNQVLTHRKSLCDHDPFWTKCFLPITFKVLLNKYKVACSNLVSNSTIIYISKMNLMVTSGCVSTMYSFMKHVRFTHSNLEGITNCNIVYNHWRKSTKIGYGRRTFAQSQNFEAGTQIIFEFLDAISNFVLFWICLLFKYNILYICKFLFITPSDIFCGK
ncbi:hypothetical protein HKD37_15G043284 [Glycine soja]